MEFKFYESSKPCRLVLSEPRQQSDQCAKQQWLRTAAENFTMGLCTYRSLELSFIANAYTALLT